MIKAVRGGGGKGMRIAMTEGEFEVRKRKSERKENILHNFFFTL